jgi:hypothetical protein
MFTYPPTHPIFQKFLQTLPTLNERGKKVLFLRSMLPDSVNRGIYLGPSFLTLFIENFPCYPRMFLAGIQVRFSSGWMPATDSQV